ncbi:MAG: hypothetical protein D6766_08675 [Verrucomicrobia bacterium]|nr:MAG: hypothetical protein D6766_08675 [Verrucomicrobiota bacterium]
MARQCHHCGHEWPYSRPPGRQESCEKCGSDWRVCLNCAHYDPGAAQQCREVRAEPVADKDRANFCEWFVFGEDTHGRWPQDRRAEEARERLRRLFGD